MSSRNTVISIWERTAGRSLEGGLREAFIAKEELSELCQFPEAVLQQAANDVVDNRQKLLRMASWLERARAIDATRPVKGLPPRRKDRVRTVKSSSRPAARGTSPPRRTSSLSAQSNNKAAGFAGRGPVPPADTDLHKRIGRANPEPYN